MGFTIHVEYLTGYAVAATPTGEPEWPPHPARLLMALAAAVFETNVDDSGGDGGDGGDDGGDGGGASQLDALAWLEKQPSPTIWASEGFARSRPDVYVPPNDASSPRRADGVKDKDVFGNMLVLPQYRTNRQPRTFTRYRPDSPKVDFRWDADAGDHADALAEACAHVGRLGHSASLVRCWLETADPVADEDETRKCYEPSERGNLSMRRMTEGTLKYLEEMYGAEGRVEAQRKQADQQSMVDQIAALKAEKKATKGTGAREAKVVIDEKIAALVKQQVDVPPPALPLRPVLSVTASYARGDALTDFPGAGAGSVFDPRMLVLALSPRDSTYRFLSAARGADLCRWLRAALLKKADVGQGVPEVLSGHRDDGSPLELPHVAVVPLIDMGGPHPRGHVLGLAVVLPREISPADREVVMRALRQVDELAKPANESGPNVLGRWSIRPADHTEHRRGLQAATWTADSPLEDQSGSSCWATVTPIALDRHPKKKGADQQDEIAAGIRQACEAIGLNDALERVVPFPVSPHRGAPSGYDYPRLRRKDGSQRRQTHALLWFKQPVVGPILLGAGRYRGWGVCRPFAEHRS